MIVRKKYWRGTVISKWPCWWIIKGRNWKIIKECRSKNNCKKNCLGQGKGEENNEKGRHSGHYFWGKLWERRRWRKKQFLRGQRHCRRVCEKSSILRICKAGVAQVNADLLLTPTSRLFVSCVSHQQYSQESRQDPLSHCHRIYKSSRLWSYIVVYYVLIGSFYLLLLE